MQLREFFQHTYKHRTNVSVIDRPHRCYIKRNSNKEFASSLRENSGQILMNQFILAMPFASAANSRHLLICIYSRLCIAMYVFAPWISRRWYSNDLNVSFVCLTPQKQQHSLNCPLPLQNSPRRIHGHHPVVSLFLFLGKYLLLEPVVVRPNCFTSSQSLSFNFNP